MRDAIAWHRFDQLVRRVNRWGGYARSTPVADAPERVVIGRVGWPERVFGSLDDAAQFVSCIEGTAQRAPRRAA